MVRNGAPRCKSGLTTNEWMRTNTRGSSSSDVVASGLALSERECSGLATVIIGSGVRSAVWASAVSLVRTCFGAACSLGGAVHAPGVKHCGPTLPCVHAATLAACSLPAHSRLTSELSARSAFPGALGRAPNAPTVSLSWCARPWMACLSVVGHAIRRLSNRHRGVPEAGPLPVDSWPGRTPNRSCDRLTPPPSPASTSLTDANGAHGPAISGDPAAPRPSPGAGLLTASMRQRRAFSSTGTSSKSFVRQCHT
ncbi:hypothetical protein ATK86_4046 [Nocardia fluminea]|uniref:Uncharacterized protein n=1 Tax=Nocardia fluminea TaxID=134984 RepID=A0A2N3VDD5_9NOCA|nr:hypothetical protein ATK86_4046 [Nocardia fluminea]